MRSLTISFLLGILLCSAGAGEKPAITIDVYNVEQMRTVLKFLPNLEQLSVMMGLPVRIEKHYPSLVIGPQCK